jgi:hypothetical protein
MLVMDDTRFLFFVALFVISYVRQWVKYQQEVSRCQKIESELMFTRHTLVQQEE